MEQGALVDKEVRLLLLSTTSALTNINDVELAYHLFVVATFGDFLKGSRS
jgi:hypothetical protein